MPGFVETGENEWMRLMTFCRRQKLDESWRWVACTGSFVEFQRDIRCMEEESPQGIGVGNQAEPWSNSAVRHT